MRDRPAKLILYICLLGFAFGVAFINPFERSVAVLGSLCCVMFVLMYIHSDRKRERERKRGFPIPLKRDSEDNRLH